MRREVGGGCKGREKGGCIEEEEKDVKRTRRRRG
jgi:hypothetical protein